jgi:hypothetical protein
MPEINITVSDDDYEKLQLEYKQMALSLLKPGMDVLPPSFEDWLVVRLSTRVWDDTQEVGQNELRAFDAIEKLVTSLGAHGFALARLGKKDDLIADSVRPLSETLVRDLKLSPLQLKRIQDLLKYYSKSAADIADMATIGVTKRCYAALHDAYLDLFNRTDKALERLGEERAIGRVEGAAAVLVNVRVMDRDTATQQTEAFKIQARKPKKRLG